MMNKEETLEVINEANTRMNSLGREMEELAKYALPGRNYDSVKKDKYLSVQREYNEVRKKLNKLLNIEAVRKYSRNLKYFDELQGDKEVILEVVRKDGWVLQYASEELRGDKEVVLEAVKENGIALRYASEELRGDKDIAIEAVKSNRLALEHVNEVLQTDKDVMRAAGKQIKKKSKAR